MRFGFTADRIAVGSLRSDGREIFLSCFVAGVYVGLQFSGKWMWRVFRWKLLVGLGLGVIWRKQSARGAGFVNVAPGGGKRRISFVADVG